MKLKDYILNKLNKGISKNDIAENLSDRYDQEEIRKYIDWVYDESKKKSKKTTHKLLICLDNETKELLDKTFQKGTYKKSKVIRRAIKHYLNKHYRRNDESNSILPN